jgi:hypothetical protein
MCLDGLGRGLDRILERELGVGEVPLLYIERAQYAAGLFTIRGTLPHGGDSGDGRIQLLGRRRGFRLQRQRVQVVRVLLEHELGMTACFFRLSRESFDDAQPPPDLDVIGVELARAPQVAIRLTELAQLVVRDAQALLRADVVGLGLDDVRVLENRLAVLLLVEEGVGSLLVARGAGLGGARGAGNNEERGEQETEQLPRPG